MKKVNALVLGLLVFMAFACGDDPEPLKNCRLVKRTTTFNNNGSTEKYTDVATVNAQGQVLEVLHKFANSNTTSIRGKSEFIYNGAGQLIRKNYYPGTETHLSGFSTIDYNTAGLMASQQIWVILTSDTVLARHEFYEYDSENRLKRQYLDTSRVVYNDYAYPGTNKIIKKDCFFDASANQEKVQAIYEVEFDSKRSAGTGSYFHADAYFPVPVHDFGHNAIQSKVTNNVLNFTSTATTTYQYNSDNYPISWTTTNSNSNGNNSTTSGTYEYNCQ